MKKMWLARWFAVLLLGAYFFSQGQPGWAQAPQGDRPAWTVGDNWTWRAGKHESVRSVVKIENFRGVPAYFVSMTDAEVPGALVVYNQDLDLIASLTVDDKLRGEQSGLRFLDWPLVVGKTWSCEGTEVSFVRDWKAAIKMTATVEDREEISVSAGTFSTFRIVLKARVTLSGGRTYQYVEIGWWSPQVKNRVKYIRLDPNGMVTFELVRYNIAP